MAWEYMKAADAISGIEGTLYATINGDVVLNLGEGAKLTLTKLS